MVIVANQTVCLSKTLHTKGFAQARRERLALMMQALWATEGLQTDTLSVENGAIVSAAARYPLLIDPQLQGLIWIASRESANGLVIVQQGQPKYIDQV